MRVSVKTKYQEDKVHRRAESLCEAGTQMLTVTLWGIGSQIHGIFWTSTLGLVCSMLMGQSAEVPACIAYAELTDSQPLCVHKGNAGEKMRRLLGAKQTGKKWLVRDASMHILHLT